MNERGRPMNDNRSFLTLICASPLLGMMFSAQAQQPHPFGGITLMRVENMEVLNVVTGEKRDTSQRVNDRFLLTVVSGNQSYASSPNGIVAASSGGSGLGCLTWITSGPDAAGSIVLGNGPAWRFQDKSRKLKDKPVCAEYGLQRRGIKQALFTSNDLRTVLPIVENYPIVPIDWSHPSIFNFYFYDVGLGTLTMDKLVEMTNRSAKRPVARAQVVENFQRQNRTREKYAGTLSTFAASWTRDGGEINVKYTGLINSDQLISSGRAEVPYARLTIGRKTQIQKTLFQEALIDKYGPPTARVGDDTGNKWFTLFWVHDLHGKLLTPEEGSADTGVQSMVKYGLVTKHLNNYTDMGPWGFGVVMSVVVTGVSDFVQGYHVNMHHGHALAHQHFSNRLQTISYIQGTMKPEEQFIPEF